MKKLQISRLARKTQASFRSEADLQSASGEKSDSLRLRKVIGARQ